MDGALLWAKGVALLTERLALLVKFPPVVKFWLGASVKLPEELLVAKLASALALLVALRICPKPPVSVRLDALLTMLAPDHFRVPPTVKMPPVRVWAALLKLVSDDPVFTAKVLPLPT